MQAGVQAIATRDASAVGQPAPVIGNGYVAPASLTAAPIHRAPPGILPH